MNQRPSTTVSPVPSRTWRFDRAGGEANGREIIKHSAGHGYPHGKVMDRGARRGRQRPVPSPRDHTSVSPRIRLARRSEPLVTIPAPTQEAQTGKFKIEVACAPQGGAVVAPRDATRHGQSASATLLRLESRLHAAHAKRLVIVGGSPHAHAELKAAFRGSRVALCLIDGTRDQSSKRARALAEGADIVVIWASTPLRHSVSGQFARVQHQHNTIAVLRRSVAALVAAVEGHLALRAEGASRSRAPGFPLTNSRSCTAGEA